LHVGGARTALFNWLFAQHEDGTMLLRIEDTDVERNKPELVEGILESLRWLGITWDGKPVFQSQRSPMYRAAAEKILAAGAGYRCYCMGATYAGGDAAPQEIDEGDSEAQDKEAKRRAPCACRSYTAEQRAEKESQGIPYAIRFMTPRTGTTHFEDIVFGPSDVQNEEVEDFVLLRSTGLPTYQLSVVVDDIDMRITHVIRGADHISNTPKQVLIYQALGAPPPIFAHVPLILGPDRKRLSKRHGATSVGSYADEGFLPEAFRNFLALMGWSPGEDLEYLPIADMVQRFTLQAVSRTNAVFDRPKLEWYNTQYLQKPAVKEILPRVAAELKRAGIWREEWAGSEVAWFARTVDLVRPRTRLLPDFSGWARAFFSDDFEYEPEARAKFWKDDRLADFLAKLAASLEQLPDWNHDVCDQALRALAGSEGVKAGLLINATRVAIVGRAVAPPLFDTMVVLGQKAVVDRLRRAISAVGSGVSEGS